MCVLTCRDDAFYDTGSTFPLQCFLNHGVSLPKTRWNASLVSKNDDMFSTWAMGVFIGKQLDFFLESFVGWGMEPLEGGASENLG